jgi:hypothetical protein
MGGRPVELRYVRDPEMRDYEPRTQRFEGRWVIHFCIVGARARTANLPSYSGASVVVVCIYYLYVFSFVRNTLCLATTETISSFWQVQAPIHGLHAAAMLGHGYRVRTGRTAEKGDM